MSLITPSGWKMFCIETYRNNREYISVRFVMRVKLGRKHQRTSFHFSVNVVSLTNNALEWSLHFKLWRQRPSRECCESHITKWVDKVLHWKDLLKNSELRSVSAVSGMWCLFNVKGTVNKGLLFSLWMLWASQSLVGWECAVLEWFIETSNSRSVSVVSLWS